MKMATIAGLALLGIAMAPAAVRADPVDNYIAAKMAERSIPGLVLGVMRDGHVVKQKAYGYANLELKAPATLDTSFALASSTKIFTAAAIMQLVEQGKITLDQPVSEMYRVCPPHGPRSRCGTACRTRPACPMPSMTSSTLGSSMEIAIN
jgi:CubicO group peptidase (beta-lactamase class C family)